MNWDVVWCFIKENYQWICSIVICFIGFILQIVWKKRPFVYKEGWFAVLLSLLPGLISEAESNFGAGHGKNKLAYVIAQAKRALFEKFPDLYVQNLDSIIMKATESILLAPTKKGDKNG